MFSWFRRRRWWWTRRRLLRDLIVSTYEVQSHAAGISQVRLVCHPDTWAFIARTAEKNERWRPPRDNDVTSSGDGLMEVVLSGPQLVIISGRLLDVMVSVVYAAGGSASDQALAWRVHEAIAEVVLAVKPGTRGDGAVPPIVIDDRIKKAG